MAAATGSPRQSKRIVVPTPRVKLYALGQGMPRAVTSWQGGAGEVGIVLDQGIGRGRIDWRCPRWSMSAMARVWA